MTLALIWAQAHDRVIGAGGVMPWHLPEDLEHFRELTGTDPVVMGRRTWESLPERYRPLPGRANIVVLTPDDNGKTVNVSPGSYVVVALGNDLDWTITSSNPRVLGPIPVTWARNGVAIFRADAAGKATIDAVGRPQCDPRQPCPMYIVDWSAQVNVIGIVPLPAG